MTWAGRIQLETGVLDLERGEFTGPSGVARLTMTETLLLRVLVSAVGEAVSRDVLHAEVWGYSPRVRTRAADQAVKRLRKKLEADPSQPMHLLTAHGSGYRMVLKEPEVQVKAPESQWVCATNLPRQAAILYGREHLLAKLGAWSQDGGSFISLLGPGGIGKTALARAWSIGELRTDRFAAGGVWFSDVSGLKLQAMLMAKVARDIGLHVSGTVTSGGIAQALAARGPTLLVVDNIEIAGRQAGELLESWVKAAPELRLLCTSQVRLDVSTEQCVQVPPLGSQSAEQMLRARIEQVRDQPLEDQDLSALTAAVEGIPLAIELAAARCSLLSPGDIAAWSGDPLNLLVRNQATKRHGSLESALAGSWSVLSVQEQALLVQCTVFEDGFDLAAAHAVLSVPSPQTSLVAGLQRLRDHSLLQIRTTHGRTRLSLLNYIRSFVRSQNPSMDLAETEIRHAEHYAAQAEGCLDATDVSHWTAFDPLVPEFGNLRSAAQRAEHFSDELGVRAMGAWAMVLYGRGLADIAFEVMRSAYVRSGEAMDVSSLQRIRAWRSYAKAILKREGGQAGLKLLDATVSQAGAAGLHAEAVFSLAELVLEHLRRGRIKDAQVCADQIERSAQGQTPKLSGLNHYLQARVHHRAGVLDLAESCALHARNQWRQLGHHAGVASTLWLLGFIHLDQHDFASAESCFKEAIESFECVGDSRAPGLHGLLGLVALERGDLAQATDILESSAAWCEQRGNLQYLAEDCVMLGLVKLSLGDDHDALSRFERACTLYDHVQDQAHQHEAAVMVTVARARTGDVARARRDLSPMMDAVQSGVSTDGVRLVQAVDCLVRIAEGEGHELKERVAVMKRAGPARSIALRVAWRLIEAQLQ